ncbi:hypothetical protein ACJX0J_007245, partial [Zea mays]
MVPQTKHPLTFEPIIFFSKVLWSCNKHTALGRHARIYVGIFGFVEVAHWVAQLEPFSGNKIYAREEIVLELHHHVVEDEGMETRAHKRTFLEAVFDIHLGGKNHWAKLKIEWTDAGKSDGQNLMLSEVFLQFVYNTMVLGFGQCFFLLKTIIFGVYSI